ncbi:MAG: type II secretion system protein [Phycisphaeraceae bacterium]|nr:type II secretion system protein [Phycisphaerales bacterium]MCB9844136.1 type II secretion system protein [Phycisphaeraceae bacterium]
MTRRGFSLIEAIAAIVILGLVAPVSMVTLRDAAAARSETIQLTRATWLANAVLETVLADLSSEDASLGFAALADAGAYLTTPVTGLEARLAGTTSFYEGLGFSWTLAIGDLVASDGEASGEADEDIYRVVAVTVSWVGAAHGSKDYEVSVLVGDPKG